MRNNLFLIDLDLTLIDKDYHPTVPLYLFTDRIKSLQKIGDIFGLISDTAYETLKQWMEKFQFNGPVISEKGALVTWPSGKNQVIVKDRVGWQSLKGQLMNVLRQSFSDSCIVEAPYLIFFKSKRKLSPKIKLVIVVNPFRRHSFGLHVRGVDSDGNFTRDKKMFEAVDSVVRRELDRCNLTALDIDSNPLYSVIVISDPQVDKYLAIPFIREKYRDYQIIAIGDGRSDASLKGHVDVLCAVGNAIDKLKSVANIIATEDITAGVLEILELFDLSHRKEV